jgi:hypothetical protein
MAVLMAGATTVHASEVTGSLSSDNSNTTQTTGSLDGTVNGGDGGSSSSGGGHSNRNNSSNLPSGSVLGAQDDNTGTPRFPNAGVAPEERTLDHSLWSTVVHFLKLTFSF